MAIPRFYIPNVTFQVGVRTYLPPAARHHAGRVLRMAAGEKASVFKAKRALVSRGINCKRL